MDPKLILILLMIVAMALLAIAAFSGPSSNKAQARRLSAITERYGAGLSSGAEARMRKSVATSAPAENGMLVSLIPNPENLEKRLRMTGRKWTLNQYLAVCAGTFALVLVFGLLRGWQPVTALFVGTAVGLGLPHKVVSVLIARRIKNFTAKFPDALELMVRGLRSGLPISETLTVVAREVPGPVGEEFRLVSERIRIGLTMDQALTETAERLGTPEFQFFCITLAIQRETGGNLAETLANLSTVLRQRSQMKLKIAAMSSEAKASAWIIGILPFVVFGLITWINYTYMSPFFTYDPAGLFGLSLMQLIAVGALVWMGTGVLIMAKMINFEI